MKLEAANSQPSSHSFLVSLTSSEYREIGVKELARQRALSRTSRPQRDTARAFGPKPPRAKAPDLLHDSLHR
jgi:cytochrome c peroxidase